LSSRADTVTATTSKIRWNQQCREKGDSLSLGNRLKSIRRKRGHDDWLRELRAGGQRNKDERTELRKARRDFARVLQSSNPGGPLSKLALAVEQEVKWEPWRAIEMEWIGA